MDASDIATLIHPLLAVTVIFPIIGMVANFAWQTRQRRLQTADKSKSKIPPTVGSEHMKLGRLLTGAVVGLALIGLAHPIFSGFSANQTWGAEPLRVGFVVAMFAATIASLVLLYKSRTRLWRGVFATLVGMGLVLLGCQPEIYRRTNEWYISHYYYGLAAALLMIFSLAILPDIYQSRKWRTAHVVLNSIALLLFVGQGFTGTRDLLEIPPHWQKPYVEQLYWNACQDAAPENPCTIQPPAAPAEGVPPAQ